MDVACDFVCWLAFEQVRMETHLSQNLLPCSLAKTYVFVVVVVLCFCDAICVFVSCLLCYFVSAYIMKSFILPIISIVT